MKKVIFISAIALAAAVSCTKSEVVDTKFNEQIGFETYLGRDAQTKAAVETAKTIGSAGVYGYYLGKDGSEWSGTSDANLWNPLTLVVDTQTGKAVQPTDGDVRYWANDTDEYAFLAYAPKTEVTVAAGEKGQNPTINYTVDTDLTKQVDVLCATPVHGSKTDINGAVALNFKHTLSRLTVKAKATAGNFDFHIRSIVLKGDFYSAGKLPLSAPTAWTDLTTTEDTEYAFPAVATEVLPKPETAGATVDYKDYSGTVGETLGNSYLMMIPVNAAAHKATLTVVYYTSYEAGDKTMESIDYTKEFEISTDFVMGKAYAINLEFLQDLNNEINFSVEVGEWGSDGEVDITEKTPATQEPETPVDPAE